MDVSERLCRQGDGGGGLVQYSPKGDLHFASLLQCVEHLDNLFKEKQITPEVKEHRGPLLKTFYVSLHSSLSSLFEGRFHYNNILNQSLNLLSSRSSLFTVG